MTADSLGTGESPLDRALRTRRSAEVFRRAADSACDEAQSSYDRWKETESLAEFAEDEAARAFTAYQAGEASTSRRAS